MIHGIKSYFGGLGDALQFSTLPEMFSNNNSTVYLVNDASFRNMSTKQIVWDANPYIVGEKSIEWTLGDIPNRYYKNTFDSFIKNWEHIHGLTPKNDFPKIYYSPKYIENIEVLADINSITVEYDMNLLIRKFKQIVNEKYSNCNVKIITGKNYIPSNIHGYETIEVNNLFDYVDLINSCKAFFSLSSGTHMLAGSIRHVNSKFHQTCFLSSQIKPGCNESWYNYQMKTKHFILPMVDYVSI